MKILIHKLKQSEKLVSGLVRLSMKFNLPLVTAFPRNMVVIVDIKDLSLNVLMVNISTKFKLILAGGIIKESL